MTATKQDPRASARALRATFDGGDEYTVGIEDEVMLLEPDTLELAPRAPEVLALMGGDQRFKLELPASQIEIITPAARGALDAATALMAGRRELAQRTAGHVLLAGAGVHPFSLGVGELNRLPRYERTLEQFGAVARRQLVCALQVHISVPGAERALAVYNAARSYLPWLAALAANAPFYEGRDTGLASVRPKVSELLPRQGIPPAFASWEDYAATLAWGATAGVFPDASTWWWELRLHPRFGTLEFRVPDSQGTVADAAAVAAVVQGLTIWLGDRHGSGERLPVAPSWKLEENRWSACRYGVEGSMVDPDSGVKRSTRERLERLIETLAPVLSTRGSNSALQHAAGLAQANGAILQRRVAADGGPSAVARWLADRFLEPWPG